jgi:hypothetical protein
MAFFPRSSLFILSGAKRPAPCRKQGMASEGERQQESAGL